MNQYFNRYNNQLVIDASQLPVSARTVDVINALYGAVYVEYCGAVHNHKYKNLSTLEKMTSVNTFVKNWLDVRGLK